MENNNSSAGKYYALDLSLWKLIDLDRKTDKRGRVHINEANLGREIAVYVSETNNSLFITDGFALIPMSQFMEVRKTRGKETKNQPLKVQTNGDIWTTYKDKFIKVFVMEG